MTILSYGQITQESINKSRDYINFKLTNYCIEKFVNTSEGQKSKIVYDSIKVNLTTKSLADTSNYNTLSAELANRFDKVNIKLSERINKLDFGDLLNKSLEESTNIIIKRTFNVYKTQYGTKFPLDDALMESNLEKEILEFLKKTVPPIANSTKPNISTDSTTNRAGNEIENNNKISETGFFSFSNLNFWNLLSLILAIGILIFCIFQISKIHKRIGRRKKITDDDNKPNGFPTYDTFSMTSRGDIDKFLLNSSKISVINSQILELQRRLSLLENSDNTRSLQVPIISVLETKPIGEEIFYMMKPVDDYFPNSNKSNQKNDTVYKFTVESNKTEALFEIHTGGAPVNDIAVRNETYIKPACEEENMPGNPVNSIITKRKGTVSLEGDKWVIKSKAIIRYE